MRRGQGGSKRGRAAGSSGGRSEPHGPTGIVDAQSVGKRFSGRIGSDERGSVTAEVAVVLPALVVLLTLLLATAHVGVVQLRLEEAARAGAREVMRGESSEAVEQTVQRLAGENASMHVASGSGWTTVDVRATVQGPIVEHLGIELHASASGKEEHGG